MVRETRQWEFESQRWRQPVNIRYINTNGWNINADAATASLAAANRLAKVAGWPLPAAVEV